MILKYQYHTGEGNATAATFYNLETRKAYEILEDKTEIEVDFVEEIVQFLIQEKLTELNESIWNSKNTIRFSADRPDLIGKEIRFMESTKGKIIYLEKYTI